MTNQKPRQNTPISMIFCLRGRCKFLMTGRGIEKTTKSEMRFTTATTYQTASPYVNHHHFLRVHTSKRLTSELIQALPRDIRVPERRHRSADQGEQHGQRHRPNSLE